MEKRIMGNHSMFFSSRKAQKKFFDNIEKGMWATLLIGGTALVAVTAVSAKSINEFKAQSERDSYKKQNDDNSDNFSEEEKCEDV